jgi:FkbM family methyltransferase
LRRNIELNKLFNVELVEKAVSSSEGVAVLTLSATNPGGHSLLSVPSDSPLYPDQSEHATVEVSTVTIDGFLAAHAVGPVTFVKIDVEGWEIAVLEGMRDCLRANGGIRVVMEYVPALLMRAQIPIEKPLEYMRALGFEFFLVDALPTPISFEALLALREKPWEGVNILCLRT